MKKIALIFPDNNGVIKESIIKQTAHIDEIYEVHSFLDVNKIVEEKFKEGFDIFVIARDRLYPKFVEIVEKPILDFNSEVGMAYADSKHIFRPSYYVVSLGRMNYQFSSVIIGREAFDSIGYFNQDHPDPIQEFAIRLSNHGIIYHIAEELSELINDGNDKI